MTTFTARYIFPSTSPPLERGTITVDGETIVAVEPHGASSADFDLGNVAIIPGLVNAHTHLDLSGARGKIPPTDPEHFCDWLLGVIEYRKSRTTEKVQADIDEGLAECLMFGETLLADVAVGGASSPALAKAQVRSIVFREIIGLGSDWQDAYFNAYAWLKSKASQSLVWKAISPHAPYTVRRILYLKSAELCREEELPSAIHMAESNAEMNLINTKTGPFIPFLARFGFEEIKDLCHSFSELLNLYTMQGPRLFIHCNYLPSDTSFRDNQTVVFCPRTHAAFNHPPHPFPEFLKRGVNVALGTDSLASNPDLDLLAEAREVRHKYALVPGETILRMATINGAKALGFDDVCGSLEPGKSADFVAVPLKNVDRPDPHDLLFDFANGDRRTMFRGEWRGVIPERDPSP